MDYKKIIFAILCSLLLLGAFPSLWTICDFHVCVHTNAPINTLIRFEYKTGGGTGGGIKVAKTDQKHRASFKISEKEILSFRVSSKQNISIPNVHVNGAEEYDFPVKNGQWQNMRLAPKRQIDFYNVLFLFCLGVYTICFFICPHEKNEKINTKTISRDHSIDFLRIIFTLIIVYFHATDGGNNLRMSVEFFFILSGYFLATASFKTTDSTVEFVMKKIIRFTPLILFGEMISILSIPDANFSNLAAEVLLLPRTGLYPTPAYNGATWYLSVLFWVSLFFFYIKKGQRKETCNLLIGLATFYAAIICVHKDFVIKSTALSPMVTLFPVSLMRGVFGIGLGYFLAQLLSAPKSVTPLPTRKKILWGIVECATLVWSIVMMYVEDFKPYNRILYAPVFILLLYLFLRKRGFMTQLLDRSVFSKLSNYCFALYATHFPIVFHWCHSIRDRDPVWYSSHKILVTSLLYVIAIAVAVFSHHLIEKPATAYLKKLFKLPFGSGKRQLPGEALSGGEMDIGGRKCNDDILST